MICRFTSKFSLLFLILGTLLSGELYAQYSVSSESNVILSSESNTPFWLQANRHGTFARDGSQWMSRFQVAGREELSESFTISAGADLIARPGSESTLNFNQGYLRLEGYGFHLMGGRFHNTSPTHNEELSSGSLGISRNASPIPQIRIGLNEWTAVPLTRGFAQVKGHLSHGWLGSRRYTDDVLLHEKVFHLRLGGDFPLNVYGGIAHYVKWGGNNHPSGAETPVRFSDYLNVFFGRPGDERTPGPQQMHTLGDHLGAWDLGFILERDDYDIHLYRQFPFEDGSNLKFKSYMDALTGLSVTFSESMNLPIEQILYEFLYTKYQAGPRESRGDMVDDGRGPYRYNENYYNHHFYRSGWVYNRRTIGNPLFTPAEENLGVVNNRIVAHHLGLVFRAGPARIKTLGTFSRNYGKRCDNRVPDIGENELFGIECVNEVETVGIQPQNQWSFLIGSEFPLPFRESQTTSVSVEFAWDRGRVAGTQFGTLFGIRRTIL
ncbi:MAG: hypothetical protein JJU46_09190 [Balneolaceae bacterium]|nr:hypothetical protein [Balneolaceae bacterium]MCH8547449.1 capsule assembly Wzi family protein [Balneolaceae bacterium]